MRRPEEIADWESQPEPRQWPAWQGALLVVGTAILLFAVGSIAVASVLYSVRK